MMDILTLNLNMLEHEHICCAIGNDPANKRKAHLKKEWLKKAFEEGLVFKRLDIRGKVFIEYIPIESAWKPVVGRNYLMIHCLWVSGQFKGKGFSRLLLDACKEDALRQNMDGIAVISSVKAKPFLTDKCFFLKYGFEVVDSALPDFELLTLKLNPTAPTPHFTDKAKRAECDVKEGLVFVYSHQCPFMEEVVTSLNTLAQTLHYQTTVMRLHTSSQAQAHGSAFGTFGIYWNGKLLTHEPMSPAKFEKLLCSLHA